MFTTESLFNIILSNVKTNDQTLDYKNIFKMLLLMQFSSQQQQI